MARNESPHVTFNDWRTLLLRGRNNPIRILHDTKRNIEGVGREHGEPHPKKKGLVWSNVKGKWVKSIELDRSVTFGKKQPIKPVFIDGRWVVPEDQLPIRQGLNIKGIQEYSPGGEKSLFTKDGEIKHTEYTGSTTRSKIDQYMDKGESEDSYKTMLRISDADQRLDSTTTPSDTSANWSSVFTIDPETGESLGVLTRNQRKAFEKKYKNKEYLQSILDKKKIRDRGIYLRQGG